MKAKSKRANYEYANLIFGGGDEWELVYYDRKKKDVIFDKRTYASVIIALNELAYDGWEVVSVYHVPLPEDVDELPTEEYLLKRKL